MTTDGLPLFSRLHPTKPFRGARLTDTDLVSMEEAAQFASKHAGETVTVGDFLRAAARGEILLRAICPREVTMAPCRDGEPPMPVPAGSIPTLPLSACKALANVGSANWRTIDGFESQAPFGLCRFTRWRLPDGEPDLVTLPADCRVTGYDVRALADAFCEPEQSLPDSKADTAQLAPNQLSRAEVKAKRCMDRLLACEAAGLHFDKDSQLRLPDGIAKVATNLGITRQALAADLKEALKVRFGRK